MKRYFPGEDSEDENEQNSGSAITSAKTSVTAAEPDELPAPDHTADSHQSEEDESSESEESSEESEPITFKRVERNESEKITGNERRLQSIEMAAPQEVQPSAEETVDDTDGLDPAQEYEDWKARERARVQRDLDRLTAAENEIQARLEARRKRQKQE